MTITKGNVRLGAVNFTEDDAGRITGMGVEVRIGLLEEGVEISSVSKKKDVWATRTPEEKALIQQLHTAIKAEVLGAS